MNFFAYFLSGDFLKFFYILNNSSSESIHKILIFQAIVSFIFFFTEFLKCCLVLWMSKLKMTKIIRYNTIFSVPLVVLMLTKFSLMVTISVSVSVVLLPKRHRHIYPSCFRLGQVILADSRSHRPNGSIIKPENGDFNFLSRSLCESCQQI